MNTLHGTIQSIDVKGQLCLIGVDVEGTAMRSIMIDTPESAPHLKLGNAINIVFKESEVVLSTSMDLPISLQNRLKCTVTQVETGDLLAKVKMQFGHFTITSIVTRRAVEQLDIQKGSTIMAMVKTNEVMLVPV